MLKCFSCSKDDHSFEESICALHSIPSVKEEETSTCTVILERWHDFIILEPDSHWVVWFGSLGSCQKPGGCTLPDFSRGRAIEVSKTYPFLIPIF